MDIFQSIQRAKTVFQKQPVYKETAMPNISNSSGGDFFIRVCFDMLSNSKDFKRNEQLVKSIEAGYKALDTKDHATIFAPFTVACKSNNVEHITIAIDCLGKLSQYNYWENCLDIQAPDNDNDGTHSMITFVVDLICDAFTGESTDEKVQLQIIKALTSSLVQPDKFALHGAILLKAIRTIYNIFLLSKSSHVQNVAQGTVLAIIQGVFSRIKKPTEKKRREKGSVSDLEDKESISEKGSIPLMEPEDPLEKELVMRSQEMQKSGSSLLKSLEPTLKPNDSGVIEYIIFKTSNNRDLKDAFKVLRTVCILSVKPLVIDQNGVDLRSQPIRSKLLALYIISALLTSHSYVFSIASPIFHQLADNLPEKPTFIDAAKEFLIMSLSRNAISNIPCIFDVSLDIFAKIIVNLRVHLKKEIAVFFTEIVIPILEMKKGICWNQRYLMLMGLLKMFGKPENNGGKMLVEIYLNYDCNVEGGQKENVWERLVTAISKLLHLESQGQFQHIPCFLVQNHDEIPPLTTANLLPLNRDQMSFLNATSGDTSEIHRIGLQMMVDGILSPLNVFCDIPAIVEVQVEEEEAEEDMKQFGDMKLKKQNIIEGIKRFNAKPKKGIQFLIETGCIGPEHHEIADFLLTTEGLNKTMIGDYLGEGDKENIAIMHCFVDLMDFANHSFIDALRVFLQAFRLPGEAQKIDRFMLKFAERYVHGNPGTFSSADTAYVLAYSVVMLNTDQHNTQVKKRMTLQDFIKNNRGIDQGQDLPSSYLEEIFKEINENEIIMKDERKPEKPKEKENTNLGQELVDLFIQKPKVQDTTMDQLALKTEQSLSRGKTVKTAEAVKPFFLTRRTEYVKPMMEIVWMSILTGISAPFQSNDKNEIIELVLKGFKHCIHITSQFALELEFKAFLSTLINFTLYTNLQDIKQKNLDAIKFLLEVSCIEGNMLGESWKEVIHCISNLEKFQSKEKKPIKKDQKQQINVFFEEAQQQIASQAMTTLIDKIFTNSVKLNGQAIVFFVRALCDMSWEEITSSTDKEHPRMYCLQRLVEISYYNMKRIRVEWSSMWQILGPHFNQVGCYPNTNVGFFCLDKLRQLSLKFMEIEELSNFKFQKDFLFPFEEIIRNNLDPKIKDMCLVCISQLVQSKGNLLKSGWKTVFGCLLRSSRETTESLVALSFDISKDIIKNNFQLVINCGCFSDLIACVAECCKNKKTLKISNQAIDALVQIVNKLPISIASELVNTPKTETPFARTSSIDLLRKSTLDGALPRKNSLAEGIKRLPSEHNLSRRSTLEDKKRLDSSESNLVRRNTDAEAKKDDAVVRFWMPISFSIFDIIMTSELEIRTKAIQLLFDTFKSQGGQFKKETWELLSKGVLFPIFDDLKTPQTLLNSKFQNKDDQNTWLSTTLIQALDKLVDLFSCFYSTIDFLLDDILELLNVCINHDNETLSRIGSTCVKKLVEKNSEFKDWDKLVLFFVNLFQQTTPKFLFFKFEGAEQEFLEKFPNLDNPPDRKEFQKQIPKCALHSMVIQTCFELIEQSLFRIPSNLVFSLLQLFQRSYEFSKTFNDCYSLRQALHRLGYMNQVPNLLKIETNSAQYYLFGLIKLSQTIQKKMKDGDKSVDSFKDTEKEIQNRLIPFCSEILSRFNQPDDKNKKRNEQAWKPVISMILDAVLSFDDEQFKLHGSLYYPSLINLLLQDIPLEIRTSLHQYLQRIDRQFAISKARSE